MLLDVQRLDVIACETALEVKLLAALIRERRLRLRTEAELAQRTRPLKPKPPIKALERLPPPPSNEWEWIPGNRASVPQIQEAVCQQWGVALEDLRSPRRAMDIVIPRQIAMMLCRTLTMRSYPEIGRRFNNRDHSTILHNSHKFEWLRLELISELRVQDSLQLWVESAYRQYHRALARAQVTSEPEPVDIPAFLPNGHNSHG